MRKYADSPLGSQVPPNWQQKVLFASVQVGDYALHGTDHLPNQYRRPEGFYVSLHIREPEDAARVFRSCPKAVPYRSAFRNRFGLHTSRSSWTGLEFRGRSIMRCRRDQAIEVIDTMPTCRN